MPERRRPSEGEPPAQEEIKIETRNLDSENPGEIRWALLDKLREHRPEPKPYSLPIDYGTPFELLDASELRFLANFLTQDTGLTLEEARQIIEDAGANQAYFSIYKRDADTAARVGDVLELAGQRIAEKRKA